jgi:hypothetical protein
MDGKYSASATDSRGSSASLAFNVSAWRTCLVCFPEGGRFSGARIEAIFARQPPGWRMRTPILWGRSRQRFVISEWTG